MLDQEKGTTPPEDSLNGTAGSINDFILLDQATSNDPPIGPEMAIQTKVAADPNRPLSQRLEAFEDIFDSEVGDTTLTRSRNIERATGLRQIYLKFEGSNPSGTQKDRIAFAQAEDAMRRGFDSVTVATCGNFGVAMALAASVAGIKCYIYLPASFHTRRIKEMVKYNAEIIPVPGDYEAAVRASKERAQQDEIYDANPGGMNTALQLKAYGTIAYEIYDELRDAPAMVALPVSNGTTLAGIFRGFLSLYRRGKISRIPKIVAGSSFRKNPIVHAFLTHAPRCEDLAPEKIRETAVNEPLINWHSIDGDLALEAVRRSRGFAANASDKSLIAHAKMIRDLEGLNVLPASTAGLAVLLEHHKKEPMSGDRYVAILTGRKS